MSVLSMTHTCKCGLTMIFDKEAVIQKVMINMQSAGAESNKKVKKLKVSYFNVMFMEIFERVPEMHLHFFTVIQKQQGLVFK